MGWSINISWPNPEGNLAMAPSIQDQLACAHREMALRKRLYPLWTKEGTLKLEEADRELNRLGAVINTLKIVEQINELLHQEDMFIDKETMLADLIQLLIGMPVSEDSE